MMHKLKQRSFGKEKKILFFSLQWYYMARSYRHLRHRKGINEFKSREIVSKFCISNAL